MGCNAFWSKNGPPTYQRVIIKALCESIDVFMKIFLDDFIIFNDMSNHLEWHSI
jgi:hypothetical protein